MAIILTSQNVDHVEMYFGLAVFLRLAILTQTSPLIKTVRGQFIEETVYFSKFIRETVHFSRWENYIYVAQTPFPLFWDSIISLAIAD